MYFKNIYKTLRTSGTERDQSEKNYKKTVLTVALTKFIFVFQSQFRSFNWLLFYKTRLYIKWAYIRGGLYPE